MRVVRTEVSEGTGGVGFGGDEMARWNEGRSNSRRSDETLMREMWEWAFQRGCCKVGRPPASSPSYLSLLFLVASERGRGLRPARGGGEKRLYRWRQKRRRCESSGLRAPFLCEETEYGFEGSRGFACPELSVPASMTTPPFGLIPNVFGY